MSPRRNRRRGDAPTEHGSLGSTRVESWPDGDWIVRSVTASATTKIYRCPGCDQPIQVGVGHVVAWRDDPGGVADRRHWHTPCWRNRARRGPRTLRAPRH